MRNDETKANIYKIRVITFIPFQIYTNEKNIHIIMSACLNNTRPKMYWSI